MTLQLPGIGNIRLLGWLTGVFHGNDKTSPQVLKSWNIYYSISELPYKNWLRLSIDNDFDALIRPDYDKEAQRDIRATRKQSEAIYQATLEDARDKIREQFEKEIGGKELEEFAGLALGMETANARIKRLKDMLLFFMQFPAQFIVDLFTEEGFIHKHADLTTPEGLNDYAHYIRNKIGNIEMQLDQKKGDYDRNFKTGKPFEPSYAYYADTMAEIRKAEGTHVPDTITTLEYCVYFKRLIKHIERQKEEHGRLTGKFPK
jgi:hypothetical protein